QINPMRNQPEMPRKANAEQNSAGGNTPENAPIRESASEPEQQSERVVAVEFTGSDTRFRESRRAGTPNPPRKPRNAERGSREYLTPAEVERLTRAAEKLGRHGHRDATMLLLAYRHALRVSELCALRWDQVDLAQGLLAVRRRKNGTPSTHPLHGPEIRALRRLARDYPDCPYVFTRERKGPLSDSAVRQITASAGATAA